MRGQGTDNDGDTKLPASALPYHKDLLFASDYQDVHPFDCTDDLIEFVCHHLCHHGFDFLLGEDLDEFQLDLLMIAAWSILCPLHNPASKKPNQYPSESMI